jgi:hypothetical protein
MNSIRNFAAATQLQDGKIIVTGGQSSTSLNLNTAEILTEDGWKSNIPSLPVTIIWHCMVTVNSTTVMVIGGLQNGQYSGKTFYFTIGEEKWSEGPELMHKRDVPSCGRIRKDKESKEMSVIVAGGYDGSSSMSSTEILNEGSNKWQAGPELPIDIDESQMIEDRDGGVVLIGGYSDSTLSRDTIYQLPHGGKDAVWTKIKQKLQTGRYHHTAFLVPDNIVDCS